MIDLEGVDLIHVYDLINLLEIILEIRPWVIDGRMYSEISNEF